MPLEIGEMFAGYLILRVLGSGGMGKVYLARHPRLPREDALKVLPVDLTADPEYRARFEREAELAAGLSHPNIVGIHDRGEEDGQFWISMDYVAGTDAARLMREQFRGGMPVGAAMQIIAAVGSALDYAHHRGLLHRDVKPANILLTDPEGQARRTFLADFGIARRIDDVAAVTSTRMAVGTAAYAAPEQLMGEQVDGRADQYALACTAFHLLAGAPPYGGSTLAVVIGQHVSAPPPAMSAVRQELGGLDPVFATAMAKQPSQRFDSCGELVKAIRDNLTAASSYTHSTQPAVAATVALPAPAPPAGNPRRRARVVIAVLLGVAVLAAAGIFAATTLARHSGPTPAGPLAGTYKADFGPLLAIDDPSAPGTPAELSATYGFRSICRDNGCVATASRLTGAPLGPAGLVFDQIDGRWVAVSVTSSRCRGVTGEFWQVFTLQPRPDGTLAGEYTSASHNVCTEKRTVTFARTKDRDANGVPDPASQPPRVVSPAEAFHGHYQVARTFTGGYGQQQTYGSVTTNCLRTGDRCMSYFHAPTNEMPLVFGNGNWTLDIDNTGACGGSGASTEVKSTGQYPLPAPPRNPIATLTGHGHHEQGAPCPLSTDYNDTITRSGD